MNFYLTNMIDQVLDYHLVLLKYILAVILESFSAHLIT